MELGIHLVNYTFPGGPASIAGHVKDTVIAAEEIGVTHISTMDHYFQMEFIGSAQMEMIEAYTTLGFIAAHTRKARIGVLVTGVTYRHPGLLAKIIASLDVLSGGRAELGIGSAWYEREHRGLGVPFPGQRERAERLEETLQICHQMWSDNDGPYNGKHFQLAETICNPRPLTRPRPPILIGGEGEKRTLPLVARYADACNLFTHLTVDGVRHKLEVLRRHCEDARCDYATIRKTILYAGGPPQNADAFAREMEAYAALGVDLVIVVPFGPDPAAVVRGLESIAKKISTIAPA